jgi:hypothetical protein
MCLLELLTGRDPFSQDLRELVQSSIGNDESFAAMLDSRIDTQHTTFSQEKAQQIADLALRCLEHEVARRATVTEVLPALERALK